MAAQHSTFVPKTWTLPDSIRRRLGDEMGRQRLMDEDGHLLVLLHLPPTSEQDELRQPAVFWRNAEGEWKSYPQSGGLAALHALMADYKSRAVELDDQAESATAPRDYFEVMRELHPLHRTSRNMLAVMEDLRKARPHERELIILRDQAVGVERAVEMALADARTGLEFTVAEAGQTQAREAHLAAAETRRLNRLVAFFFPIATLAAVFGINPIDEVLGMPGLPALIFIGVALGFAVRGFVGRRHG